MVNSGANNSKSINLLAENPQSGVGVRHHAGAGAVEAHDVTAARAEAGSRPGTLPATHTLISNKRNNSNGGHGNKDTNPHLKLTVHTLETAPVGAITKPGTLRATQRTSVNIQPRHVAVSAPATTQNTAGNGDLHNVKGKHTVLHDAASARAPDFDKIKTMCRSDEWDQAVDGNPLAFKTHRILHWPHIDEEAVDARLVTIYKAVRDTGVPNAMSARLRVPSALNITKWEELLPESPDNTQLLSFLKFGFPMGYMGPTSSTVGTPNHPSATQYPRQMEEFIETEKAMGALHGPFVKVPFREWAHVSPLMTREKATPDDRRVITDLTFPTQHSVNAYIFKNSVYGAPRQHSLPTVDAFVKGLVKSGRGSYMATLDIARAYKNLVSDPLDWPLSCISWNNKYMCDTSMAFGARSSSCHMQRVANAIVAMLEKQGITASMYLDDIIILASTHQKALGDVILARQLLKDLGLPEAVKKAQAPANVVTWLGITIDANDLALSIPDRKITQVMGKVNNALHRRTMSKKSLQSLLGSLLHVAKCVAPARLFVGRLLENMRKMRGKYTNINSDTKKDLRWFQEFCAGWNGVSLIPTTLHDMEILVDASGSGIGGYNGSTGYARQVCPKHDPVKNIAHLEGANIVVALHTFLDQSHAGTKVRVHCDNEAAVAVMTSGKGKDTVLLDVARAAWMIEATLSVKLLYVHIPGVSNIVADRLSRAHLSSAASKEAGTIIKERAIHMIKPCMFMIDNVNPSITCSSGLQVTSDTGLGPTGEGQSEGNRTGPPVQRALIPQVLPQDAHQPPSTSVPGHMLLDRGTSRPRPQPGHNSKQGQSLKGSCNSSGHKWKAHEPPKGSEGPGRTGQGQKLYSQENRCHTGGSSKISDTGPARNSHRDSHQGSYPDNVPRCPEAVRGTPSQYSKVGIYKAPHTWRHKDHHIRPQHEDKMGQEHAGLQGLQVSAAGHHTGQQILRGTDIAAAHKGDAYAEPQTAPHSVPGVNQAHPHIISPQIVDKGKQAGCTALQRIYNALSTPGSSHRGPQGRMSRDRHSGVRWVEFQRPQAVH